MNRREVRERCEYMAGDAFEALMESLGFPGSRYLRKILEHLLTPTQASVVQALPGAIVDVAEKTGLASDEVTAVLEELWLKGVVFPRDFRNREYFRFARDLIQLHDATLATKHLDFEKDREYCALWHEFGMNEFYKGMGALLAALFSEPIWRVIPAYGAIKTMAGVVPHENIVEMIRAQRVVGVAPCSCRQLGAAIGEPCTYTDETATHHCLQFGKGAEYVIARDSGRALTEDEAIDMIEKAERDALVHMGPNTADMNAKTICNCCSDCCEFFKFYRYSGVPPEALTAKSRFEAFVDQETCTGCQTCIERCHFEAIGLAKPEGSKKYKARVDADKCFGCGVCVIGCEEGAMKFRLVRPPGHIPSV